MERKVCSEPMSHRLITKLAVVAALVATYFASVYQLSIASPVGDDYYAILHYLNVSSDAESLSKQITLLFSPHAEHQIAFVKIIGLAMTPVDFRTLIILGNLFIFGIFVTLFLMFDYPGKNRIEIFLPVAGILFNLTFGQSAVWAMAALSNFPMILWSILAVYLICKRGDPASFTCSVVAAIASSFSFGGGILVFVPMGIVLLLNKERLKAILLLAIVTTVIVGYIGNEPLLESNRSPISDLLVGGLAGIVNVIRFAIAFIGSSAKTVWGALLLGTGMLSCFCFLTIKKAYKSAPASYFSLVFLNLIALSAAVTRYTFGLEYALVSRYAFYSVVYLALVYLALIELWYRNRTIPKRIVELGFWTAIPVAFASYIFLVVPIKVENIINAQHYSCVVREYSIAKLGESESGSAVNHVRHSLDQSFLFVILPHLRETVANKVDVLLEKGSCDKLDRGEIFKLAEILKASKSAGVYF